MSAAGAKMLMVHPYAVGVNVRRHLLGADDSSIVPDYGTEARAAALERGQQDRLNRVYDAQDAQQKAMERQQVLDIAQQAVTRAGRAQVNILTAGQNSFRKLLFAGGVIAALSLATLAVASVFGKTATKGSRSRRSRSRRKSRPKFRRHVQKTIAFSESPVLSKGLLS